MNATLEAGTDRRDGTTLTRGIGTHGRVAVSWAAAGGITLGGILVAVMTLTGRLSGLGLLQTATGLFVIGAVIGLAHGATLGFFGRSRATTARQAAGDLGRATLYALPALAVAWLVTIWVAMTMAAGYLDRWLPTVGVTLAWIAAAAFVVTAGIHGVRALRNAYARWPERTPGTALVAASFTALMALFLADRPEIWGLDLQVTETGAVLLAGFLTFWVAGPAITLALRLLADLPLARPKLVAGSGSRMGTDVALGLVVGAALGILAVPFLEGMAPAAVGMGGGAVVAVSQAVVDEIALRLVLLTGVAWALLRWHRIGRAEAAIAAVAATVLVQLALYAPEVAAVGFPTTVAATGFAITTIALPAVAFGVLYWRRGFGAALAADAAAVLAILFLAA